MNSIFSLKCHGYFGDSLKPKVLKLDIKKHTDNTIQTCITEPDFDFLTLGSSLTFTLTAFIKDSDGIITLLQIKNILDSNQAKEVHLELIYLPYGRQDRNMDNSLNCFSLKVFTKLLNNFNFSTVTVYDPHSDVIPALINNCKVITQEECIKKLVQIKLLSMSKYDAIVSPDGGALKKIYKVAKLFNKPVIECNKQRDILTNDIISTSFNQDVKGLKLLICDDIFDGGRSFIALSDLLKKSGAKQVDLYTTFGIFSYGVTVAEEYIDNIYSCFVWKENVKNHEFELLNYYESLILNWNQQY